MQWDYGKFILKQLDYSPSFSTIVNKAAPRWLSARRKLELVVQLLITVQWLPVVHEMWCFDSFSEVLEGILDVNG